MLFKTFYILLLSFTLKALAQNEDQSSNVGSSKENAGVTDRMKQNPFFMEKATPKKISEQESKAVCKKFEGKYIAFYGDHFLVKKCERVLVSADELYEITRKNNMKSKVIEVDASVLAAIPIQGEKVEATVKPNCTKITGRYISADFNSFYYIEPSCQKRLFPDWETFEEHRKTHKGPKHAIIEISNSELTQVKEGKPFDSLIDKEKKEVNLEEDIEILPIDKVCKPLIGKFVTFYDNVYEVVKIKNSKVLNACERVLVNAEEFSKKNAKSKVKTIELSSSQAYSIPERL